MRRRLAVSACLALLLLAVGAAAQQSVYQYTRIATNTTTAVKTSRGVFVAVVINTKAGAGNQLFLYDNTAASGTLIGVIDTSIEPGTWFYNVQARTGLTAVTTGGTPGDLTIVSD